MKIKNWKSIRDVPYEFRETLLNNFTSIDEVKKLSREDIVKLHAKEKIGSAVIYDDIKKWLSLMGLEITEKILCCACTTPLFYSALDTHCLRCDKKLKG